MFNLTLHSTSLQAFEMSTKEKHSAPTILDDIINELNLTYDSATGLVDGQSIRQIPSLSILLNLQKLLEKLSFELGRVQHTDDQVISRVEEILSDFNSKGNTKRKRNNTQDEADVFASPKKMKLQSSKETNDEHSVASELDNSKSEPGREQEETLPPVQLGSFSQNNDTRLKNPKSEFVPAQSLSAEAITELGLYSEENNGLETQDREYLKRKYGVASYPESTLQDMLPGPIPDLDFSLTKAPSNQVQFTTFQSYVESYFRNYLEDDLEFLREKYVIPPGFDKKSYDPTITPFLIPRLGSFYADLWAEEDATLGSKLNSPAYHHISSNSYKPRGSIDDLSDENLYTEEISCGPLSSRLLSAVLNAHEGKSIENEDDESPLDEKAATELNSNEDYKMTTEINDFYSIEERLKRELKYIGIFMNLPNSEDSRSGIRYGDRDKKNGSIIDSDEWIRNKEDDEVCAEIRSLQAELKEVTIRNRNHKKKLIPIIEEQLAWQEYVTVLDDLDKQVDQAYMKRLKAKNRKKKTENVPSQQAFNGMKTLLEKRKRWIDTIGELFKPPEIMKRLPLHSIFHDTDNNTDLEDEDNIETEEAIIQK